MKALTTLRTHNLSSRSGVAASVHTLLANVLILGLNVVTGIITARILGPGGRGEQAAIILWPQFLAYTFTLGLPSALLYNLKRYPDQASRLFSAALLLATSMGGAATVVGVLFISYWLPDDYSPAVVRFAQLCMLISPVALLGVVLTAALQAREEFTLYNAVRYLQPLLTLLALVLLAATHHLTPFTAALSYLLPGVPVLLWLVARLWRLYRPNWQGVSPAFRRLTSYGLRSYGADLAGTLANQLDRVLVVGFLNPVAMGLYVVAFSLSRTLHIFQASVVPVLFPKAAGRSTEAVVALTGRAARVSLAVTALPGAGLLVLGPWVLNLIYGSEYLGAVPLFRILVVEAMVSATTPILVQAFMAVDRPGVVTILQSIGVGITVSLLLVLVTRYGLKGAGFALLISALAQLTFAYLSFPLVLKARPPRLWLSRAEILGWRRRRSSDESSQ